MGRWTRATRSTSGLVRSSQQPVTESLNCLHSDSTNPGKHAKEDIELIANSLREVGNATGEAKVDGRIGVCAVSISAMNPSESEWRSNCGFSTGTRSDSANPIADAEGWTYAFGTAPDNGNATVETSGTFTYVANNIWLAGDQFKFIATGPNGEEATITIVITYAIDTSVSTNGTVVKGGNF